MQPVPVMRSPGPICAATSASQLWPQLVEQGIWVRVSPHGTGHDSVVDIGKLLLELGSHTVMSSEQLPCGDGLHVAAVTRKPLGTWARTLASQSSPHRAATHVIGCFSNPQ